MVFKYFIFFLALNASSAGEFPKGAIPKITIPYENPYNNIPDSPRTPRHLDERYTPPRDNYDNLQRINFLLGQLTIGKDAKGIINLGKLRYFYHRDPLNKNKYEGIIQKLIALLDRKIEISPESAYQYQELVKFNPLTSDDLELLKILKMALVEVEKPIWQYTNWYLGKWDWFDFDEHEKALVAEIVINIDNIIDQSIKNISFSYVKFPRTQLEMLKEFKNIAQSLDFTIEQVESEIKQDIGELSSIYWSLGLTTGGVSFPPYSSLPERKAEMERLMSILNSSNKSGIMNKVLAADVLREIAFLDLAIDAFNSNFFNGGTPPAVESFVDGLGKFAVLGLSIPYHLYQRFSQESVENRIEKMKELIKNIRKNCSLYLIKSGSSFIDQTVSYLEEKEEKLKQKLLNYNQKDEIWILSLDGGGIRGVIAATVLEQLSTQLGAQISDLFDLFAGTSTGGIIALGLTTPKEYGYDKPAHEAKDVLNLYLEKGNDIFPQMSGIKKTLNQVKSAAYNPEKLENLFFKFFGDYAISSTSKPVIVTAFDQSSNQLKIISTYDAIINKQCDFPIWRSARSTSAAPTYFPPHITRSFCDVPKHVFVDGGVAMNNPVHEALLEAKKIYPNAKKIHIVSIGTGKAVTQNNSVHKGVGGMVGALEVFSGTMEHSEKSAEVSMKREIENLHSHGYEVSYYRLNPDLEDPIALDGVDGNNILKLKKAASSVLNSQEYQRLVEDLSNYAPIFLNNNIN